MKSDGHQALMKAGKASFSVPRELGGMASTLTMPLIFSTDCCP